jgi:cytochrome c oxidase subunit 2
VAEEHTPADGPPARTPEEVRPKGQASLAQMLVIGLVASVAGVALGLLIDWFPTPAAAQAGTIDTLYDVLVIVSVPVFVLVMVVVLFSVWKFRQRPGEELADGPPIHGNTLLEVVWTAIPAILLVALCSYAYVALRDIEQAQANEMRVNVIGQQFTWTFEYPQAGGPPVRSNELYLARGRPVYFAVRSRDVIHDFWVPNFRMKIDAVPGIETYYRITPDRVGDYPVVCAELCGLGHAFMRQTAHVVEPADFGRWLQRQRGSGRPTESSGRPDGRQIFSTGTSTATACGSCHRLADADTSGTTGPNLDEALRGADAAKIRRDIVDPNAEIARGFEPGIMPAYGKTLSGPELQALVRYLERVTNR